MGIYTVEHYQLKRYLHFIGILEEYRKCENSFSCVYHCLTFADITSEIYIWVPDIWIPMLSKRLHLRQRIIALILLWDVSVRLSFWAPLDKKCGNIFFFIYIMYVNKKCSLFTWKENFLENFFQIIIIISDIFTLHCKATITDK